MVQEKDEKGNTNTIFKMELISKFLEVPFDKKEEMILVDMNQVTISNLMIQMKDELLSEDCKTYGTKLLEVL